MFKRFKKHNQRGDTIIEVMFAVVIIGVVLAGAHNASSRSLKVNLESLERTKATEIAETQFELIAVLDETTKDTIDDTTGKCINLNGTDPLIIVYNAGTDDCTFDNIYEVIVTRTDQDFNALVEWLPPGAIAGQEKSRVTMQFKDFNLP